MIVKIEEWVFKFKSTFSLEGCLKESKSIFLNTNHIVTIEEYLKGFKDVRLTNRTHFYTTNKEVKRILKLIRQEHQEG